MVNGFFIYKILMNHNRMKKKEKEGIIFCNFKAIYSMFAHI